MGDIALRVHLRSFALGRCGKRDDAKHPRADTFGDRLDRATLAGPIATLEHDADLEALVHNPLLQLDQLDVQPDQLVLIVLPLQLAARRALVVRSRAGHLCRRHLDLPSLTPRVPDALVVAGSGPAGSGS